MKIPRRRRSSTIRVQRFNCQTMASKSRYCFFVDFRSFLFHEFHGLTGDDDGSVYSLVADDVYAEVWLTMAGGNTEVV